MNQILVTQKLYVTPELKKKKRIYKIDFILSVLLVVVLICVYIYAEFIRNKDEEVARDILTSLDSSEGDMGEEIQLAEEQQQQQNNEQVAQQQKETRKTVYTTDGTPYTSVATVTIPSLNLQYPVLLPPDQSLESVENLIKVAPCKFWGPNANEVGNFCIVGHNYRNTKFFSKVPNLRAGDTIDITGVDDKTITYVVYDKYTVAPENTDCLDQATNGRKEVTLITCTDDSQQRWIIKAREAK